MSIVETATASASGSILAFLLIKLWRKVSRRIKVRGLLLDRKIESLETYSNDDVIFINIAKELGKDYTQLERHDVRLKVFPNSKKILSLLKDQFKKKTIVIASNDFELLEYMDIPKRHIYGFVPSDKYLNTIAKQDPNINIHSNFKFKTVKQLNKKHITVYDNDDEIFKQVRQLFNLLLK
jgi:hypothetical protein